MNDDGTMARLPELVAFAQFHDLKIGAIDDLIAYRRCMSGWLSGCGCAVREQGGRIPARRLPQQDRSASNTRRW